MAWNGQGGYPQGGYPQQPYPSAYPGVPPQGYPGGPLPQGYPPGPQQQGYPPQGYPAGPGFNPPPPQQPYGDNTYSQGDMYGGTDYKQPDVAGFEFSDATIRRGFIRKVYSILMVQLAISTGFIAWFMYDKRTRHFLSENGWVMIVAFITLFVCMIALACCGDLRRKAPHNFILLGLFTVCESLFLAVISSKYRLDEVLLAAGITTVVCLGLTIFAFQTKWDFTVMGGVLFVAVLILFLFGILSIFIRGNIFRLIYASLGALIFSIYLIYDTQMMMGGEHKYSISPEEYVFAALNLYLDIINIFIYILTIIGSSKD